MGLKLWTLPTTSLIVSCNTTETSPNAAPKAVPPTNVAAIVKSKPSDKQSIA